MLDSSVYYGLIKDHHEGLPEDFKLSRFLDAVRAIIEPTKNAVIIDYNLVSTYINGLFRALPYSARPNGGLISSDDRIYNTYNENTTRYVEKWDTAASTVSQNTYSRFRQALLPDGLDSFVVDIKGANNSMVNELFTSVLRNSWNHDALTEIDSAVGDYMNYGTAVMTNMCRHIDINLVKFYELLDENGKWTRAYYIQPNLFYGLSSNYAARATGLSGSAGYMSSANVSEPVILKIDDEFPEQLCRLSKLGTASSFAYFSPKDMKSGVYCKNVYKKNTWEVYDRGYMYEELYVARMGPRKNGYGTGCGVNALGPIIEANFTVGTRYTNLQRIVSPNWLLLAGVEVKTRDGQVGIDTRPGGITTVKSSTGIPMSLDQMIQRDRQAVIEMEFFLPYRELFLKELDAAYNAFLFKPYEPVPASTTATGAILQLEDTINAYRAKADSFMECILLPLAQKKLRMEIEKAIYLAVSVEEGMTVKEHLTPEIQQIIEAYRLLKDTGIDLAGNVIDIKIKDLAYVRRRQSKALEIQEQINLTTMAMQTAQINEDFAREMVEKIQKHYK